MSSLKEKIFEGFIGFLVVAIWLFWFITYWIWLYHVNDKHSKETLLSIMIPPWSLYRGLEFWFHKDNEGYTKTKSTNISEWKEYNPSSKKFSITLPSDPTITSENKDWISNTTYALSAQDMRIFYFIDHTIISSNSVNIPSLEAWAKNTRKDFKFKIEKDEISNNIWNVSWKIIPDEEFKMIKWSNNGKLKLMTLIDWNNIYTIKAMYDETLDKTYIDTFFNSFKLIK